jgi:hypothetical protein
VAIHGSGKRTLEQGLDFCEFAGIIQLAEVFGFLRQVLPLHSRISLEGHDFGCRDVEVRNKRREVETWTMRVSDANSEKPPRYQQGMAHSSIVRWRSGTC